MTKVPLGGTGKGADFTDRGKKATKKNMLTDSKNIPPSVLLDGDNRHDKMFLRDS
jgi:putative transposase